uniref:L-serine deaminase n=1 Tax=Macrostomum lignano TaxID=282301 RepID=A0A1I8F725_9PLAT
MHCSSSLSSAILDNYTVTPGPGAEIQSYTTFQQPMVPIPEAAEAAGGGSAAGQSDSAAAGGSDRGRTGSVQSGACKTAVPLSELLVPNDDDPDLYDPNCDPDKPQIVRFQDVSAAAFKIRSGIVRTPCDRSHMSRITNMEIFFKKEFLQYTGSFKERGLATSGAEAAWRGGGLRWQPRAGLGLPRPGAGHPYRGCHANHRAPDEDQRLRAVWRARVIVMGSHIGESKNVALKIAKSEGLLYVNGYDHPQILAGQGTIGLEILEQIGKPVDAIVFACWRRRLIAGVAVGVKTMAPSRSAARSFSAAIAGGSSGEGGAESRRWRRPGAVPLAGANAFYSCRDLVDRMVTVSEEFIALSILRLDRVEKTVVEGAGAAALARAAAGAACQSCTAKPWPSSSEAATSTRLSSAGSSSADWRGRPPDPLRGHACRPARWPSPSCSSLLAGMGVSIKRHLPREGLAEVRHLPGQTCAACACEVRDREHGDEELLAQA